MTQLPTNGYLALKWELLKAWPGFPQVATPQLLGSNRQIPTKVNLFLVYPPGFLDAASTFLHSQNLAKFWV